MASSASEYTKVRVDAGPSAGANYAHVGRTHRHHYEAVTLTLSILLWAAAIFLTVLGIAGLVVPALPGPLLIFLGLVAAAWAENFEYVGVFMLTVLAVLAALAYALDFVAAAFGARRYGASAGAAIGALLGALVGILFGLPGLILGPFIGAVLGQFLAAPELQQAVRAGWGAWVGLVLGIAAKAALSMTMIGLFVIARLI